MRLIILTIVSLITFTTHAQERFFGLFIRDTVEYHYSDALVQGDFFELDDSLERRGYNLLDWNLLEGEELITRGIWRPKPVKSGVGIPPKDVMTWTSFIKTKRSMVKGGYLMINMQYYIDRIGMEHFLGKWRQREVTHKVWKFSSFEHLKRQVKLMKKDEFVLKEIEVNLDENRAPVFLALFYKREFMEPYSYCYEGKNLSTFMAEKLKRLKSGFHLTDIEVYQIKGQNHYVGIFEKGKKQVTFVADLQEDAFFARWEELEKEGFLLVDIESVRK